jgi:hypothetical protein
LWFQFYHFPPCLEYTSLLYTRVLKLLRLTWTAHSFTTIFFFCSTYVLPFFLCSSNRRVGHYHCRQILLNAFGCSTLQMIIDSLQGNRRHIFCPGRLTV